MLNKEYLNEDDRRTTYMHDFFMYGMFSEQYNRFTLAYLLVMKEFWNLDTSGHFWMEIHITVILMLTIFTHGDELGGKIFGCKFSHVYIAILRMGDTHRRHAVIYKLFTRHSRYGINI